MRATGWACDVCKTFETTEKDTSIPSAWMQLNLPGLPPCIKHICSNECLLKLVCLRMEIDVPKPKRQKRASPKDGIEVDGKLYTPANHQRWHVKENKPNED